MDYKKLLVKYIRYIVEQEGTDFLGPRYYVSDIGFSKVEWDELGKLAEEASCSEDDS